MFTTDNLDKTMAKAKKVERLTRATKFSNVFRGLASGNVSEKDLTETNIGCGEIEKISDKANDFIIENPDEKSFDIIFKNNSENNLPFFRSIQEKLAQIYA